MSDLKLALKITADLNNSKQQVEQLGGAVEDTGKSADAASESWRRYAGLVRTAQEQSFTQSNDAVALNNTAQQIEQLTSAVEKSGKTASAASEDWRRYAEESGKRQLQQDAAQQAAEAAQALEEQRAGVAALLAEIDPLEKKLSKLDDQEQRLNASFKSGAVDAETYNNALAKINQQRDVIDSKSFNSQATSVSKLLNAIDPLEKKLSKLDDYEERLTQAFNAGRIEVDRYHEALTKLNQRREQAVAATNKTTTATEKTNKSLKTSSRELTILSRQLASGHFSTASTGLAAIAQRAGILPPILGSVGIAFSAVVAAGTGLYNIVQDINTEQTLLNRSIQITGNYAGITAGQINQLASSLESQRSTLVSNREILAGLNETGQFTGMTLGSVGEAAIAMSELTGKSANEVIGQFSRMKNNVTEWALETNRQYHYLDLATYQRIRALEQQGRVEEAMELASQRFTDAAKQRVSELNRELNWLQQSLTGVNAGWQQMKQNAETNTKWLLGLDTDEDRLARLRAQRQRQLVKNQLIGDAGDTGSSLDHFSESDKKELARLEAVIAARQEEAQEAAKVQQAQEKAITAQQALNDVHERQKTDIERQNEAIEKLIKNYQALWATADGRQQLESTGVTSADGKSFSGGQYSRDVKTVQEQYPDKLTQQYEQRLEQLKMEEQLSGKVTRASRVRYETEHGSLKKLNDEQKKTLITQAEAADKSAAAFKSSTQSIRATTRENQRYVDGLTKKSLKETETAATIRIQEINARNLTVTQRQQAIAAHETLLQHENIKTNLELQVSLLKLQGRAGAASALEIEDRYSKLFKELNAQSNDAGIALANMSKQLELDKLPLVEAQQQIERLQSDQSRREQLIQAQQQAGLLSNYEATQLLLQVQREVTAELEKQIPILTEAAEKTGDPAIIERLATVKNELALLKIESNEWVNTLQSGIDSGLNTAFMGLIDRSHDLSGALTTIAQSVVNSFAQMASQNLSGIISAGVGNLFSSGTDAAQETATAAAAATQYSTAIITASTTGAGAMTTALTTGTTAVSGGIEVAMTTGSGILAQALNAAFVSGAGTIATAITTASSASSAGKVAGAAVAAATGGLIIGPGTGTSDSIPAWVSNNEFIMKNAAVRHYGVDFMRAVNSMQLRGFSEGGLVTPIQAPTRPSPSFLDSRQTTASAPQVSLAQTIVFDGGDALSEGLRSVKGQRAFLTFAQANKSTLKQILGNE